MKYIPMSRSSLVLVGVSSSLFFIRPRPISSNSSSAAWSFWSLRLALSAMYCFESGLLDSWSLIWVTPRSIRSSHCLGSARCLLMMLMKLAISQTCSLTSFSICSVVKSPLSCQIPMISAAHWLTPTPVFTAQIRTCRVGILIVLSSATTDFANQKASHPIVGFQQWSMIEWWILNRCYSKQVSGVLNMSSRMMRCGSRGEEGVSKVLKTVSNVGRPGQYIYWLGAFSWSG